MPPKRKRTNAAAATPPEPVAPQPSSRDASAEDAEDPILQQVSNAKHRQEIGDDLVNGQSPARKLAGGASTASRRARAPRPKAEHSSGDGPDEDSSASMDVLGIPRKPRLVTANAEHDKEVRMESPPRAGLVDPVGYHTNPPPQGRTVRVYADGVFDLCHLGHMRQLEQAKRAFPNTHLTVGVTGDAETHRRKGLTVLSARERAETVRHCRWVDEVIEDCPWIVTAEFLDQHLFDYVAHDDLPYGADEGDDIYKPIKEQGKFLVTQRTEGVSTTGIITKIVKDYEQYISRQLRRGTTRQELNVSWLKKNELDLKRHVADIRKSLKTNWPTSQDLGKELRAMLTPSRPQSPIPSTGWGLSARRNEGSSYFPNDVHASGSGDRDKSPPISALSSSRLSHLEIPPQSPTGPVTPNDTNRGSSEFARGYSLGLVGGIRSWMTRNRRNVLSSSRPPSPHSQSGSDESYDEAEGAERGRKRRKQYGENRDVEADMSMTA